MKQLKESINYVMFESFMNDINDEILNESLQCSILQKISKQLKPFGSKNGNNWYNNRSFSGLFGSMNIAWDEIQDSDFEKYEAGDKEGIKRARAVLTDTEKHLFGIVLFPSRDGETFDSMVCWRGLVNFKEQRWDYEAKDYKEGPGRGPEEYKQKWLKEDCEKRQFYILDYSKFEAHKKQADRRDAKQGSFIPGDADYYAKLAKDNVERYRKIIAKRKAERAAKEDTIAKQVEEIVTKAMQLATKAAQNPDKYIDAQYQIGSLMERIYETQRWDSKRGSVGQNGLLYLFKSYLSAHLSMAKDGGYGFQEKGQDSTKKAIEAKIKQINDLISSIEDKVK